MNQRGRCYIISSMPDEYWIGLYKYGKTEYWRQGGAWAPPGINRRWAAGQVGLRQTPVDNLGRASWFLLVKNITFSDF